jgi:hypothetical protein
MVSVAEGVNPSALQARSVNAGYVPKLAKALRRITRTTNNYRARLPVGRNDYGDLLVVRLKLGVVIANIED